jgi:hypothetical protein
MRSPEYLRKQAEKCRRLASQFTNSPIANKLLELATEYDAEADGFGSEQQMHAQDNKDDGSGKQQGD